MPTCHLTLSLAATRGLRAAPQWNIACRVGVCAIRILAAESLACTVYPSSAVSVSAVAAFILASVGSKGFAPGPAGLDISSQPPAVRVQVRVAVRSGYASRTRQRNAWKSQTSSFSFARLDWIKDRVSRRSSYFVSFVWVLNGSTGSMLYRPPVQQ